MNDVINTFSGVAFNVFSPRVEDINIVDIMQGLSNICRFTGQISEFYSVLEHSCRVHDYVEERFPRGDDLKKWALLHDSSEAYLIDVARPVKVHEKMSFYRETEARLMAAVAEKFELTPEMPKIVDEVDRKICVDEARVLFPIMREDLWAGCEALNNIDLSDIGWTPREARREFNLRFEELFGDVK